VIILIDEPMKSGFVDLTLRPYS